MDIKYVDILPEENLQSIYVADVDLICWSARSSSRRRRDVVKGVDRGYRYFSQLEISLYQSTRISGATSKYLYIYLLLQPIKQQRIASYKDIANYHIMQIQSISRGRYETVRVDCTQPGSPPGPARTLSAGNSCFLDLIFIHYNYSRQVIQYHSMQRIRSLAGR